MPQLPPLAAAIFVACLLTAIVTTTVVVQIRSRRRRTRLAEMVRATAPIPRPAVSTLERPPDVPLTPLRGQSYRAAGEAGHFDPFQERPARPAAPGRPARRLVAYAAPVAVEILPAEAPLAVSPALAPGEGIAAPTAEASPVAELADLGSTAEVPELEPEVNPAGFPDAIADLDVSQALPRQGVSTPDTMFEPPPGPVPSEASAPAAMPAPVLFADNGAESVGEPEAVAPPSAAPTPDPGPRITVLPPRPAVPALPALMTREVALGDAARVIRSALPGILTMTDGRQLRRAVAVGAATSVVAAAFAIRGRRR